MPILNWSVCDHQWRDVHRPLRDDHWTVVGQRCERCDTTRPVPPTLSAPFNAYRLKPMQGYKGPLYRVRIGDRELDVYPSDAGTYLPPGAIRTSDLDGTNATFLFFFNQTDTVGVDR